MNVTNSEQIKTMVIYENVEKTNSDKINILIKKTEDLDLKVKCLTDHLKDDIIKISTS